jgi:hypothetical protein
MRPSQDLQTENPDHEWFADLFYVNRKKCVIWVHGSTLLTFIRPAVTAADLREFHPLFHYEFRTALAFLAMPEALIERFGVHSPDSYARTNNRSILGSMLDYRKMFSFMVDLDGGLGCADIQRLNAMLNETPMSFLGWDSAIGRLWKILGAPGAV